MSIQIKYVNSLGVAVTDQQLSMLDDYSKITIESGSVKMIEWFMKPQDQLYTLVTYFLSAGENKQDIINQYTDAFNYISCKIYLNKQSHNGFGLWDYERYSKTAEIIFKGKEVFDSADRLIFSCTFDLITGELLSGATKRYYSGITDNPLDDEHLMFSYNSDGSINLIYDLQEQFGYIKGIYLDDYLADTQFSQVDFPWDQHPYYHNVLPYLPAGSL